MSAVASSPAPLVDIFPSALPQGNALAVFGVLGGLLAARARWLPSQDALQGARVVVDTALGLILFRLGTTLHPVTAARNRPLPITALAEGAATFAVIVALLMLIGAPAVVAVLAAAIAVSSSPAVLNHVAEQLHAEGPTIDRAETLVAVNNVLSLLLFSMALPIAVIGQQFDLRTSLLLPNYQEAGAVVVAVAVAWLVTSIARLTRSNEEHLRFALVVGAVMLTLGLSQSFRASGLFAGLALGIACRWLHGRAPDAGGFRRRR